MWTVFRFSLCGGDTRAYHRALEILRGAGFRIAVGPKPIEPDAPFPAAVLADVQRAPSEVTRVIFGALLEAGLHPVAVSGCPLGEQPPAERGAAPDA
jgi:hypothetical protein